jgi:TolA-binding protein
VIDSATAPAEDHRVNVLGHALGGVLGLVLLSGCASALDAQPAADADVSKARLVAQTSSARPGAQLGEAAFWQLIEETRHAAGDDTGEQSSLLEERLSKLSARAIVDFAQIRKQLDKRLYTWRMWGAAYVIEDGCSDDCFRDFRGYVISLGRDPYAKALADPDSLASVAQDAETGDWENADDVAPDAYSSATSDDYPLDDSDLSGPPRGTPFDENDSAGLARLYPKLAERF